MSTTMNQIPANLRAAVPKLPENPTEEEFAAWMGALPPCPGIGFADDDDDDPTDAEIEAEIAAGGGIPHEIMVEWFQTWGKPGRLPFDEWFAARNG